MTTPIQTAIAPAPINTEPSAPINAGSPTSALSFAQRIVAFRGQSYLALLALLKNPGLPTTDMARAAGVTDDSIYRWRVEMPGFRDTMEAIRSHAGDLRSEYAQAAMREAVPPIVDRMITRAQGDGRDAQRAAERILEQVGVLRKEGDLPEGTEAVDIIAMRIRRSRPLP